MQIKQDLKSVEVRVNPKIDWGDIADMDQFEKLITPRIDSAASMAAAWEGYLLSECLRLGCWRIWFVQWPSYEWAAVFLKTRVFAPWDIKAAQAFAKKIGANHVTGLNLKRWLLYTESAFNHLSGSSPNKDLMREIRRVMRARCIMKCMKPLLRRRSE